MNTVERPVFVSAACDFCGSSEATELFQGPDRLLGLPGTFSVVRCQTCGLIRQDPRPTAATMEYYYPPAYEPYSIAIDDEPSRIARWSRRHGMNKRRRAIERLVGTGRLLDVGCATGNFLNEMARTERWHVEGVEPNVTAAAYGCDRFGLLIHEGNLEKVALPDASFDVVTMWNVFEHLHTPMANLREVARLLRSGGLYVFSIPNLNSVEARHLGRLWMGWELPRHLYFPTHSVMRRMLGEVGLELLGWDCLVGAYPSFLLSLRFTLQALGGDVWWTRSLLALSGLAPIQLAAIPLFGLLTRAGRGSLITGFARRVR